LTQEVYVKLTVAQRHFCHRCAEDLQDLLQRKLSVSR
jgi:hypothetical protein